MARLDQYAEQLFKHRAKSVLLASNEPVVFRFNAGDKASQRAMSHAQLSEMVGELLPPPEQAKARAAGVFTMQRQSQGGPFTVLFEAVGPHWRVELLPGEVSATQVAPPPPPDASVSKQVTSPRKPATTSLGVGPEGTAQGAPGAEAGPHAGAPTPNSAAVPKPPAGAPGQSGVAPTPAAHAPAAQASPAQSPAAEVDLSGSSVLADITLEPGEPKINAFLRAMVKVNASDLHLSSAVVPMLRLHGSMQPMQGEQILSKEGLRALLDPIFPQRNRDEFQERNDTDFAHTIEGVARFRVNVFMDRHGPGAVFRQIPFDIIPPDKLGLPESVLRLCWLPKGMVLVTGPTGSGKSTTLASLVDVINRERSDHIITIEDPIEFVHENKRCLVNQREVSVHTTGFKAALRAALREDPDIVLVGEMRDLETVAIAIETAETGHLVFGTLHTNTAPSTVDRIIDQFPHGQQAQIRTMLSESLKAVIAQTLCKRIGGGRVAAYEIMIANDAVKNLIREGKTYQLKSTMQTAKKLGMQTMNDHLMQHVKNELIEPKEAFLKSNDQLQFKEMLARAGYELEMAGLE